MDKEAQIENLTDSIFDLMEDSNFEEALRRAREHRKVEKPEPLPRLKVMADPKNEGKHPLHDNRWIVTANTEIDWNHNETEWALGVGSLVSQMTDCQHQSRYARLFAAAPDMLDALEGVVSIDDISKDVDIKAIIETAKAAIAKARG